VHQPGFDIDRPDGSGDYLFVFFNLPAKVLDLSGFNSAASNTCILYAPGFKQLYHGEEILDNSYFHFHGENIVEWLELCGIPVNTAMSLGVLADLAPFIRETMNEQLRQEEHWQEVVSLLTCQFFVKLGRIAGRRREVTTYQGLQQERIRTVRATVHSSLETKWTVPQMAQLANMSPSRFAALYPEYFKTTPLEDLINSRLDHAAYLLKQTSHTIDGIAELCGFSSAQHFSKMFRQRRGQSPGQCR
jgi:AraC-like DNA-binding protein